MESVQIRSLHEKRKEDANKALPQGKVNQMCKEWLVREDGSLAYQLQNQEIEKHYDHNRFKNKLVRSDLQEAITLQRTEEEEAEFLRRACEEFTTEQEEADARVAKQIQEQLTLEERTREIEDERIARQLYDKEKLRLEKKRKERELKEVAKAALQVASDPNNFSDFYLDPPAGLSERELKNFREDQDEEFARLLQEQETKRRGNHAEDTLVAIETQDWELAKLLQEQEKAKARRAKERAKQRLAANQPDQTSTTPSPDDRRLEEEAIMENVAIALDPTYSRGLSPEFANISNGTHRSTSLYNYSDSDNESPPLPYMPIQGQRRSATLEKGKKKKAKDSCKSQ